MSYSDAYDADDGVAIVGLAGRFPGARDIDEFWTNLLEGRESISSFAPEELEPAGAAEMEARRQPNYVRSRGVLDGVELFDAEFFGFNPSEAAVVDPQQRVFMETAWEALENAGHDPRRFAGPIGVFAGMSNNTYWFQNLAARQDVTDLVGWVTTMMGNEKDYLATRVAYKFDLRGPALNIQTACSTSLVTVVVAVQSLLSYQCDMALAGGVSVTLPQKRGYLFQEGGIISPDGHCRTFDEHAEGTVFGNGVGVVTLRRLGDALEDGDTIYAVIKGAAMNNDGSSKVSFTAPSVEGHAGVIGLAQALAGIDPATISYVEAHGTATPLGDPVEIAGLTQAFRAGGATGKGFCAIGSVKSNIGHLDAAAGVAGLIKTTLALHHKTLPPSLHFSAPNPRLELESSPFRVVTSRGPWEPIAGSPRRAGVSSFGVGGTNAHVVLEEAPPRSPRNGEETEQLIVLSGRTGTALDAAASRLRDHLEDHPELALADVAFTLGTGRRRFPHRRALVARGHRGGRGAARRSGNDDDRLRCPRRRVGRLPVPRAGRPVGRDGACSLRGRPGFSRRGRRVRRAPAAASRARPARGPLSRAGQGGARRGTACPDRGHAAGPVCDRVRAGSGMASSRSRARRHDRPLGRRVRRSVSGRSLHARRRTPARRRTRPANPGASARIDACRTRNRGHRR